MQTRSVWMIEHSELDSLSNSDVARIKAFMSHRKRSIHSGCAADSCPRKCAKIGAGPLGRCSPLEPGWSRTILSTTTIIGCSRAQRSCRQPVTCHDTSRPACPPAIRKQ